MTAVPGGDTAATTAQLVMPTLNADDLAAWLEDLSAASWDTSHFPHEWARQGIAAILGVDMPYRRYSTTELTVLVARAKAVLSGEDVAS